MPGQEGFKQTVIKPDFIKDLTWVSASYHSIQGDIVSKWQKTGNRYKIQLTIPPNTTAKVYLPANADSISVDNKMHILETSSKETIVSLGSGSYSFDVRPVKAEMKNE